MNSKRIFAACCCLVIVLFSWGCKKKQEEHVTLKLGYAPIADAAQIYVGIEEGFFEKQGLKIDLLQLASGAKILEAVGSGSVQIGLSSYVPLVFARAAGVDLVAITGGPVEDGSHREHAILVRPDSKIKSPKDLADKTIALNGLKNIDDLMLQELLEKYNIDRSRVRVVEIPFPRMETVLQAGEVDAVAAIEPFLTRAINHGSAKALTYNYVELHNSVPIACYVAKESWLRDNKEVLRKFSAAFDEATDFCLAHPEALRKIIAKYSKLSEEELKEVGLPTFSKETNPADLQELIEKMKKRRMIDKELSAKDMVYK